MDLPAYLRVRQRGDMLVFTNYGPSPARIPQSFTGGLPLGDRLVPPAGVAVLSSARPPPGASGQSRYPAFMGLKQFVNHMPDLIQIQLSRSMRVQHGGMIHRLFPAGNNRINGELLDRDIGLDQAGKMCRQFVNPGAGFAPSAIDITRHFHTGIFRQIADKVPVQHITINHIRRAGNDRRDNPGRIFNQIFLCIMVLCQPADQLPGRPIPPAVFHNAGYIH